MRHMTDDPSKTHDDRIRWRMPSVGVLTLFAVLFLVGVALLTWRVSRSGIRRVLSLGGEVSVDPNRVSRFAVNWSGIDLLQLSTDHDVAFVYLEGPEIDDEIMPVLRRFPNLRIVQLEGTTVTDIALIEVAGISQLNHVSLSESPEITDEGIALLGRLPKLRHARLEGLLISGANLGQLSHLEILDLDYCPRLGSTVLQELCEIPNLRNLSLYDSHITNACFQDIKGTPNLEELDLSKTRITDGSLTTLVEKFPGIKILYLENLRGVTDEGARQLTKLTMLEHVSIHECRISTEAAKSLQDSMPRCKVYHESLEE